MTVVREGNRHISELEIELMKHSKAGDLFGLAVPNQMQEDRAVALNHFSWVLSQLRKRDIRVRVTTRHTPAGLVLFLEDLQMTEGAE